MEEADRGQRAAAAAAAEPAIQVGYGVRAQVPLVRTAAAMKCCSAWCPVLLTTIMGVLGATDAFFVALGVAPRLQSPTGAVSRAAGSDQRHHHHHHVQQSTAGTITSRNSDTGKHTSVERRLSTTNTIHRNSIGDQQQQQQSTSAVGHQDEEQELILREFSMDVAVPAEKKPVGTGRSLLSDPGVYERRVRAECLREGGETATVVRWHVSRVDEETGRGHVEVRC